MSDRAVSSLHRIVMSLKSVSLIGGEDARTAVVHRIKKLTNNPAKGCRKANFEKLAGEYYSLLIWDYRVYFKIEESRVVVLEIIVDKETSSSI
ncbi:MAG: mRNA-degrading endonuclease RelE of RelBE toxin-antitoxin system [Flavobacteriales bacterium]|jgi:mRNA-degrading endonuclease RelE of RelBE toxin-antitoxin system